MIPASGGVERERRKKQKQNQNGSGGRGEEHRTGMARNKQTRKKISEKLWLQEFLQTK